MCLIFIWPLLLFIILLIFYCVSFVSGNFAIDPYLTSMFRYIYIERARSVHKKWQGKKSNKTEEKEKIKGNTMKRRRCYTNHTKTSNTPFLSDRTSTEIHLFTTQFRLAGTFWRRSLYKWTLSTPPLSIRTASTLYSSPATKATHGWVLGTYVYLFVGTSLCVPVSATKRWFILLIILTTVYNSISLCESTYVFIFVCTHAHWFPVNISATAFPGAWTGMRMQTRECE